MSDFQSMRREYSVDRLSREDLAADPLATFDAWLRQAADEGVREPNAMALATVGTDGPSCRVLLLKGRDARGLRFFTNYESRKAADLEHDSRAAATFWWPALEKQVRVQGLVERLSDAESDEYFATRPRETQLGAWASCPQSGEIENRTVLEARLADVVRTYPEGREVPRPPFWGGYRLVPTTIEFWQGRKHRLHDRFVCRRQSDDSWAIARLSP
jgi:pyridoxamine 5'-phosphate oxidase